MRMCDNLKIQVKDRLQTRLCSRVNLMRKTQRWLGIDFSGNYRQWSAGRTNSNVWVATIENSDGLRLVDLRMVQKLEGNGSPFERLICLLGKGDFRAAAIDAPFSIPSQF